MRRICMILLFACILAGMLFHVPLVIQGAHTGLELWYESVLPSILPFMIITSLLLQQVQGSGICFLGLLCGLPIGGNLVNQQSLSGRMNSGMANSLLCICNITSPMFILGYIINQTLQGQVSVLRFLCTIYFPIGFYALWSFFRHRRNKRESPVTPLQEPYSTLSLDDILKHSLQVILMVGLYIMLFCIIIQFLLHYLPGNSILLKILASSLEITNGIHVINQLSIPFQQKTALIAGLTSFGGICSILQTKSVLTSKGLSIFHYTCIKLCMGGISYLLALIWL